MVSTGYKAVLLYGYEQNFKEGNINRANKVFGLNQRVGSISFDEGFDAFYTIGNRLIEGVVYREFTGSISVDFYLSNPWFFRGVLGGYNVSGSQGTYTHTFQPANNIPSLVIVSGTQEAPLLIKGVIINSASISSSVNEVVSVSLDMSFAEANSLSSLPNPVTETFKPFTFAHGTLTLDGNTLALVQAFEVTINNEPEYIRGLGSRTAQTYIPKGLTIEGRISIVMQDNSWLQKALENLTTSGPSKIGDSLKLTLNNGEQTITLDLRDVYLREESFGIEPNEKVVYELPFRAKTITVTAINNIASMP